MPHLHALDRKMLRDLWKLRSQVIAIALVLACGVAIFLTAVGMIRALEASLEDYYARQRFAEIFASATRAPNSLAADIAALPGIRQVEPRVAGWATLDLETRVKPASARILSLPETGAVLNVPIVISGRLPGPDARDQVAVNSRFAEAHGFHPGDRFTAVIKGTRRDLTITGTVKSPELIYALPPGGMMPDDEGYAVIWMPRRAAEAFYNMSGAFNDLQISLQSGVNETAVKQDLDRLLKPWGGSGAYGRDAHLSHAFIDAELNQLKSMARVLPPVFFAIAGFLVNMVLGRIVTLERAEIGLLKALGYRNSEIALHYLAMAGLVGALGIALGWLAGGWLASDMAGMYAKFYDLPWLLHPGSLDSYALSGLLALAVALLGATRAALAAARLAPAVAMGPPAPPRFKQGLFDQILRGLRLGQPAMIVLRGLLRWPLRAALTSLGLACGVAVLVASNFMGDSIRLMVNSVFYQQNRQHITLALSAEAPLSVLRDAMHLPGVLRVEPQFDLSVALSNGALTKKLGLTARPRGGDLVQLRDTQDRPVPVPPKGIVLSQSLADQLALGPGDMVRVEPQGGRDRPFLVPVTRVVPLYVGLGATMELDALAALLREPPRVTALNIALDERRLPEFYAAIKDMPALATATALADTRDSFDQTVSENIRASTALFLVIAVLITSGVAYNGARIQLSERARELASLRILGFTRNEVGAILIGETAVLALAAQPVGWALGAWISWGMVGGFDSDLFRLPLVLTPANFAKASLVALTATAISALIVRRRLDRADLIAVLKTRE